MYLSDVDIRQKLPRRRFVSPYLGETSGCMGCTCTDCPQRRAQLGQAPGLPGFTPSEERALRITSTFETGRPLGFGGLTGNFDQMGLSFGLMQWNIGTGSLQPLLREFANNHPQQFTAVFGSHANAVRQMLGQPQNQQLQWARSINDANNQIVEPWAGYFRRLEQDQAFRQIQLARVRVAMNQAIAYARQFNLRSERGLALMFDNVTQNGPAWLQRSNRATTIQTRRADFQRINNRAPNERELLAIIANVVADSVLPQYREDVRRRRMTIVNGQGQVHGTQFDLERQYGLTDQPWEFDPIKAAKEAAERRVPIKTETAEERVQRILKEPLPTLPPGKSFRDWLDGKFAERGVPKFLRDSIWKSFIDKNWGVMGNLLNTAGFNRAVKDAIIETARAAAEVKVR